MELPQIHAVVRPVFMRNLAVPWPLHIYNENLLTDHPLETLLTLSTRFLIAAPDASPRMLFLHLCDNESSTVRYYLQVVENPSNVSLGNGSIRSLFDVDSNTGDVHVQLHVAGAYEVCIDFCARCFVESVFRSLLRSV